MSTIWVIRILLAGIMGTTLMTLFSYILGKLLNMEFGEPKLLNKMLDRSRDFSVQLEEESLWGWVIHYFIGLLFSTTMIGLFHLFQIPFSWVFGAILGFLLGLVGVVGWITLFQLHKSPPKIELPAFLFQLIGAHIIFGLGATLVFRLWPL